MEILRGLGIFGTLIFLLSVLIFPISVYAAQKWAYKCFKELEKLNANIEWLITLSRRRTE